MSLFGSSPPAHEPEPVSHSRVSLFEDEPMTKTSTSLFADEDHMSGASSPWDMPTPRKQQTRADLLRSLLPASDVPDNYGELFDAVASEDSGSGSTNGHISTGGVTRTLAAAGLDADDHARVMAIVAPGGDDVSLGRNEFNVLLALIGLAQEGEAVGLDGVDERRRNLPKPKLSGFDAPTLPGVEELAAKPPQRPSTPPKPQQNSAQPSPAKPKTFRKPSMDFSDDPWNTPDVHKGHGHAEPSATNGDGPRSSSVNGQRSYLSNAPADNLGRTTSTFTTDSIGSAPGSTQPGNSVGGWGSGYFADGPSQSSAGDDFGEPQQGPITNPFAAGAPGGSGSGSGSGRDPSAQRPSVPTARTLGSGRTGSSVEENIVVQLMPEKEGMFLFQHHNYEVTSARRGSKVIRRYSDFVWLLDCLHKRYPFRVLPLLPPKRVAVNGNHLSNDGAFIEKRRRGLGRFLNALVRHPVLALEQLVIMFLTVPTELSVWRKQATISVQDEFVGRALPPGLEDSLSPQLDELFDKTRQGVRRSAELYISACNIMDRLVKRSEGVAADHARMALGLQALTEASADTYATEADEVPLLNDGLVATSKHLRTGQSLMEDEARAWDAGVLEDLKRQRDALVAVRDMFDRRERLDRDNIPSLERRIQANEAKLANLRGKPEGLVKPGEIEKVVEAIIKDKESIVNQHNRSIFVKECVRDELIYFQHTQYHVSRWNQDWAQERVKYAEMLADNWRRLLDELDGMPLGD